MTNIALGVADFHRQVARGSHVLLRNRVAEKNPVLSDEQVRLLARPGRRKLVEAGAGPVRGIYEAPGAFENQAFVVSDIYMYKVAANTGAVSLIGQIGEEPLGTPTMCATAAIGVTAPAYLFLCDGGVLWCYTENGHAKGHLQASAVANNETVTIGTTVYKFTTGSVDAGTPLGTLANPWLVKWDASYINSIGNLYKAINDSGVVGDYSSATFPHPDVRGYNWSGGNIFVRALTAGIIGNGIVTTETGANMAWDAATLTAGGTPGLFQIEMPDDVGAISVAHLSSFVIVIPVQGNDINGRFYWIEPGETTVDSLNYATAERSPDPILQALVFGDKVWFPSTQTTESWFCTGNLDAPFEREQGILFDRGSWEGTAVQVKDSMILTDSDGGVFQISQGLKRISTPQIEERIRRAIQASAG